MALNSYKKGLGLKFRAIGRKGLNSHWEAWEDGQTAKPEFLGVEAGLNSQLGKPQAPSELGETQKYLSLRGPARDCLNNPTHVTVGRGNRSLERGSDVPKVSGQARPKELGIQSLESFMQEDGE